ncbi:MAG: family 14 glycosylhydrolase [Candidatus Nealsonbacteria bacterium]|nr:family 14 glycosylhydrolase [Candidatus Nealsonbacteria bacterium]
MIEKREIIQQWQYLGRVHPELLEDKVFEHCQKSGITSLQSYLYWAEIEKEPEKIDFSSYDILVEKLKEHNLKWVPFFILGPDYATPDWFKKTNESVYAQCLEHKKESKIQSIWNPFLPEWVDRFLRIVSEHYQDKSVLESICLGISGNWGESIYPVEGGFHKNFHSHQGWWCEDKYAVQDFKKYIIRKYDSLSELNNAWKTNFSSFELINFPNLRYSYPLSREIYKFIPFFLRPGVKFIYNLVKNNFKKEIKDITGQQQWLDFTEWYMASMTNWAEFWFETARKYFPDSEIYLVTGGNGNPMLGADFSAQTKIAAKYKGGIRITNQTDDYSYSFAFARLISSASKFYGSYFTTEEVWINKPERVMMRIFDVITSGAKGFYCKNIIGTGRDYCTKKDFSAGEPTKGAEILSKNLHYFQLSKPIVKAAIFFPNTSIAFEPLILDLLYKQCAKLRDVLDFDLLDENMIRDGALEKYQYLLVLKGKIPEGEISERIKNWIKKGGILSSDPKIIASDIDNEYDRVYATRFADKIMYYNANDFEVRKKVGSKFIKIEGNSIKIEQNKL